MECFQGAVALATVTKKTRFHNEAARLFSPRETVRGGTLTLAKIKIRLVIRRKVVVWMCVDHEANRIWSFYEISKNCFLLHVRDNQIVFTEGDF